MCLGGALVVLICRRQLQDLSSWGTAGGIPRLFGAVSAGGRSEQGSERLSGPLRRIGSSFCPVVGVVAESRVLHPRNPDTGGGQEGMEVAER